MGLGELLGIVIGTLGLFTTIVLAVLARRDKKREKHEAVRTAAQEERAKARQRESELTMNWMVCATTAMGEMAEAIKTGRANGALSTAVGDVHECGQDLTKYLIGQNALKNH